MKFMYTYAMRESKIPSCLSQWKVPRQVNHCLLFLGASLLFVLRKLEVALDDISGSSQPVNGWPIHSFSNLEWLEHSVLYFPYLCVFS